MTQGEKRHKHMRTNTPTYVLEKKEKRKRQGHPTQTAREERREASQIHLALRRSRCVEEVTGEERDVAGTLI